MINVFSKSKHKTQTTYSNYTGVIVLYIISAILAATLILPNEENLIAGSIKAIVWPLYLTSKVLH